MSPCKQSEQKYYRGVEKGTFEGCQPQLADNEDREDFPQAKFANKEGFPHFPTSTSTNGVPQICRQA